MSEITVNSNMLCTKLEQQSEKDSERRAVLQNINALEAFLASVERRAFRIAEFAVGNTDDALDIVQEAMLKLADKYAHKVESEWPPLFYRILQNKIMDCYRHRNRQNHHIIGNLKAWLGFSEIEDGDEMQHLEDKQGVVPDRQLDSEHFGQDLKKALKKLPMRQQQTFLLRAWEGLDVRQTADAMRCSEGSVKTHYFRALQQLRDILKDHH